MNLADQFTYFFCKKIHCSDDRPVTPDRRLRSAEVAWLSKNTPRSGEEGTQQFSRGQGSPTFSWTWLWGCRAIQVTWGENKNHYEPTSINMESRRFFFSWLKLILASRSLKGNEKTDGYLIWWLSLGLICCEQSQLLGRVASSASHKNIANVWWLSDFGEKGWTSIAKPEFLFEGCFCNTCFSLDVSWEEQVLLAFFELLFVAKIQHWKNQLPASTIFRNGVFPIESNRWWQCNPVPGHR